MRPKSISAGKSVFPALALAWLALSCAKNPMATSAPSGSLTNGTQDYAPTEVIGAAAKGLFFAPQSANPGSAEGIWDPNNPAQVPQINAVYGTAFFEYGGLWQVENGAGVYVPANPSSSSWDQNSPLFKRPGFSGAPSDWYAHWAGRFTGSGTPNPGTDYNQFSLVFSSAESASNCPGYNISNFTGVSFYVRGNGNFTVSLLAGDTTTGQVAPFAPYNGYYAFTYAISAYTNGSMSWSRVLIPFTSFATTNGGAASINAVLTRSFGLQFSQQSPNALVYWMDLDYVRFY